MENRPPKRKIIKRQQKFVIEDSSQDNDFLRETASDCKGGRQYTKFSKTFSGKSAIRSNAQWNTVSKLSTRASVNRQYFTESRRKSVIKRPLPETAVPDIQDLSVAFKTPVKSLRRSSRRIIKKKATECLFDVTFTPEKHCVPSQTDIEPASSLPLSENDGTVCHKRQKLSFDDAVLDETMDHASQVDGSDVKMRTGDECLYPDSTDMAPIASSWKLSEIGPVKPSKKQKKFLPNGLAANFSLFTRREAAARTFWKHNQTIPVGYIDVQKPMEPVASSKPSGLVLTVVEVTDEDLHVLQVLCLVNGRQDRDAGHFDRNDSSEGSVTVIFSAQEFKKAELGVGAVIQLTQPWMTLPSADRSTTIILCPYFFQKKRKSSCKVVDHVWSMDSFKASQGQPSTLADVLDARLELFHAHLPQHFPILGLSVYPLCMPYALGGQERSIIMDAYQLGGSHSVLKSLQPTATQCKYAQFWKNVVAHVQISFRTQNFADAKAPTFSGKELVDAVVQYIKDIQFIQRSYYIPPVAQDSRTVAWKVCLLLLQARVIEPANAATRKSDDSNGRFTEAKRYRIRQDVNIDNDLADLMGSCSLSSIGPPSVTSTKESNKENRSADISYDAFLELFGPVPCEVTDDEMSCASSDSSNSESVSSERSFVSFWDLNFSDCMDIWREACLARLLSLTDIPVIEKLLKTSDHEDILPSNTRSSTLIHNLVLPPLVQAFIELLDDSPYLLSVTETDPAEIHPLTLLSPVLDHCTKRFSYSPHPSLLDTILSRRSSKVQTVLPERHADLHNAIYKLLQNNPDTAVEALQLYNLMLPWTRREYFRKLLKFLHVASAPDIPRLHRDFTNRDFLMNKFQDVIFSRAFVTEEARLKLLLFMLEYAKDIFGIPAGMKENVEARICAAAKCGAMEESVISETCHRKALYHRNRDISSQQSLMSLLMYCDQAMPVSREKAKFMSRFEQTYPAMFHQYFGTSV